MPSSNNGKQNLDILELLRQAEEQNHADMNVGVTERKPEMEKTLVAEKEAPSKKRTKVTKRINAETAELIDQYSTKKENKTLSDTQKLRMKLAEQNENNELLGYLAEEKKPVKSERVDKLYEMINDARTRTFSDLEKKPPEGIKLDRFSDEPVPEKQEYTQEQMFPLGDTLRFDEEIDNAEVASFDSDYEQLTEKLEKREMHFENENESEGQVRFVADDEKLELMGEEELDETDINLRLAFEMMEDEDGTLKKIAERNREKSRAEKESRDAENRIKYTSREQNSEIASHYRRRMRGSLIRIIIVGILALGILFLEIASKDSDLHGDFAKQGRYGIVYILIDLQLLFFIAIAMLGSIRNGLSGIFKLRLNTDSLLVISIFFAAAYSLVTLFGNPYAADLKLYNLPAAFAALCAAVSGWLCAKKDYRCFRIVASKRPKYTACELTGGTKEADEFYKYLFEDSDIYTVKRAHFIDGFVERTEKRTKFEDVLNFIVPLIFFAGAALFITMSVLGSDIYDAYSAFSVLLAASVPATAFFVFTLPTVSANRVGVKHSTAFIGNAVAEEYATASVLSFADTEVYPASLVKITNIRMYGDFRIDGVLTDMAKVFKYVGGPLSKVLSATLSEQVEDPNAIRVIESSHDGLCVAMDGHNYFLGKRSYMRRYRFETPVDEGDDAYDRRGGSVMYVVVDEKLAAKLYIKYTLNPLFDSLLRDMYKAGLCLGVKTLDPNINNEMIASQVKFKKCPISVLRGTDPSEVMGEVENATSGIVCNSTLHNFLKMFSLCDKARHATKSNIIISVVSVVLSFAAVGFLSVTGAIGAITSVHAVAFQLFWLLPIWLISFLMLRK
jgi:cation transport ATPase